MGVDQKHQYRFGFLQSEKWKAIRLEKLVHYDACCVKCGIRNLSNDVHHLSYPPSWQEPRDCQMIVLCRSCHEELHRQIPNAGKRERRMVSKQLVALGLKRPPLPAPKPPTPPKPKIYKISDWESRAELGRILAQLRREGFESAMVIIEDAK